MVEATAPQLHRGSNQLVREAEEKEASDLVPCAPSIGDCTEEAEEQRFLSVLALDGASAPIGVRCRI
jgi:hypothetical protein